MSVLDTRTIALIHASALAATTESSVELYEHLQTVKDNGEVLYEEVYEAFLQLYLFAGFPAALEAVRALYRVWRKSPSAASPKEKELIAEFSDFFDRGMKLYRYVYADKAERVRTEMVKLSPDLAAWALIEGYGKTLARPNLDTKTRELCIVAVLTRLGWQRQLYSHILGAKHVGATTNEITEAACIGALGNNQKRLSAEQLIEKMD